jgi:hypothetical protein
MSEVVTLPPRAGGAGGQPGSERAYPHFLSDYRRVQNPHRSARGSIARLTVGAASIVIAALSLGLWWAIWEAVCSLASVWLAVE